MKRLILAILALLVMTSEAVAAVDYFTLTSNKDGSVVKKSGATASLTTVYYQKNNGSWTLFKTDASITLAKGDILRLRGKNSGFAPPLIITGNVSASGNIMTLVDETGSTKTIPSTYFFSCMFKGSTGLTSVASNSLPATTLTTFCYLSMFEDCTSLTTAPALPATTLADYCYSNMFEGCTSLTTAPALPATTLSQCCYMYMFNGCTSLTTAPALPAATLTYGCYWGMFSGCTKINPAANYLTKGTKLAELCYHSMFNGCTSLTNKITLGVKTLAVACYYQMFRNCTALTTAPDLPATALAKTCYREMFSGCTKLKQMKVSFTSWDVTYATTDWVSGVACKGVFECPKTLDVSTFSTSRVPRDTDCKWTVVTNPLIFTATTASTVGISNVGGNAPDVWYSVNGGAWTQFTSGTKVSIPKGKKMRVAGSNASGFSQSASKYTKFIMTGSVAASGNVMALIDGGKATTIPNNYCFFKLFNGCTVMTSSPTLPATTLTEHCYDSMFQGCTALTSLPALNATTMQNHCYKNMFNGCTKINPAASYLTKGTKLANYCYESMFSGCTSLTNKLTLGVTTLYAGCYAGMFYDCSALVAAPALPATTLAESCYCQMFEGCTSLATAPALPATTLLYGCYEYMFYDCSALVAAPALPATTLAESCYYNMFHGCKALTKAPDLPATTLLYGCYEYMFLGCSKLKQMKVSFTSWDATDATWSWVSGVVCNGVFECPKALDVSTFSTSRVPLSTSCKWLIVTDPLVFTATTASTVGISNVGDNAPDVWYSVDGGDWTQFTSGTQVSIPQGKQMKVAGRNESGFSQSSSKYTKFVMTGSVAASGNVMALIDGGTATTIPNNYCFYNLFNGCTVMTSSPTLPSTTLTEHCYEGMFRGCAALTSVPTLNATTMQNHCYKNMFNGCTKINPATSYLTKGTTLANYCYEGMFQGCTSLTNQLTLGVTTLAEGCYLNMFYGCTALTKAPTLPATTLVTKCYKQMFYGCSSLKQMKVSFTSWDATDATTNWVSGVACKGVFDCPAALDVSTFSTSRVPLSTDCKWLTVTNPLIFTATTASTVGISNVGGNAPDVWYSVDGGDWTQFTSGTQVSIPQGKQLRVAGKNESGFSQSSSKYTKFVMTGSVAASGNVMALIDGGTATTIPNNYCFYNLFNGCTVMTSAPTLPSSTLTEHCYEGMFYECTALTNAPVLPATTLAESCYSQMFEGCTSLATAPALPAKTLAKQCYDRMFYDCTSLTNAPVLPATTLAERCYSQMFKGCTSLATAPALPAKTLAESCYDNMFCFCSSLNTAPELPATTLTYSCYRSMFSCCTSLTTAPELPATTLASYCYVCMFQGCTNLNYLKVAFTDWNSSKGSTTLWVGDVACSGTFECPDALDVTTFSSNRVPLDTYCQWLVQVKNVGLNNTSYYRNIQDAYSAAVDGDEIEVLEDIPTQTLAVTGKRIDIDGGGHTLKNMTVGKNAVIKLVDDLTLTGDFSIEAVKSGDTGATESGSFYEDSGTLTLDGDAYFDLVLKEGDGKVNDNIWYGFCVPFTVETPAGIICVNDDGSTVAGVYNKNYVLNWFDSETRTTTSKGWTAMKTGDMEAGKFYGLGTDGIKRFRFKKKDGTPLVSSATITLEEYVSSSKKNAGWNAIGNSTLYNTTLTGDGVNFVQTYNDSEKKYNIALISGTQFSVGTPYFVQYAKGMSTITQNYADAGGNKSAEIQEPQYYEVCIAPAGSDKFADRMYIAASTDALDEYEPGKDVMNLTSGTPAGTQCWIRAYSSKLSACYAPLVDLKAEFNADFFVTKAGNYSIYIENEVNDGSTIYVTENGEKIWNLNESAFETALHKGENSQYGLLIEVDEDAVFTAADYTTDSGKVVTADNGIIRICNLEQGDLYVIYDIDGKTLASGYADDDCVETLTAPNGTAVVRINDEIIKILR